MPAVLGITAACCFCKFCAESVCPLFIPDDVKDGLSRPVSHVLCCMRNVKNIEDEVEKLKEKFDAVERQVDIEKKSNYRQKTLPEVERWLKRAEKIKLRYDTKIQGKLDGRECNSCFSGSICKIGKTLDEIQEMMDQSKDFGSVVTYNGGDRIPFSSIYRNNNKSWMSRGEILEKILHALEDSTNKVISIYGLPGAGKTTLLEMLVKGYGDNTPFHHITSAIKISDTPDISEIQKAIARSTNIDLTREDDIHIRPAVLHHQLKSILEEQKRILVVLDDVCSTDLKDFLIKVGIPFDGPSCTILMSSRRLYVGTEIAGEKYFQLDCLDEVEAMDLFRESLGSNCLDKSDEKYTSMENAVLQKCHGLPSAITEWAKVITRGPNVDYQLNNLHSSEVNGVNSTSYRSIRRSFDLLKRESCDREQKSSPLQKFFLLSCLFPQGTRIAIEDLIRYGIGLSLFDENASLDDITQQAMWRVDDIKALSLFERKDDQGYISINKFIQDVAISIASEEKYLLLLYVDSGAPRMSTEKYTTISMNARSNVESNQELLPAGDYFQDLQVSQPELKALHLTKMRLSNIRKLEHLATLSVEYCEIEDASLIRIFTSLRVLSLRGSKVKRFLGVEKLDNLKILDLTECCFGQVQGVYGDTSLVKKLLRLVENLVVNPSHLWCLYLNSCSIAENPTGGVVPESTVGISRSLEHLYALEIEIPSTCPRVIDDDIVLGEKLGSFKISIGCKVPSSFKELYFFKKVLLFEEVDAKFINREPLRKLLEKTECLSLVRIENLDKVYWLPGGYGSFLHLKCLHISHCNQMNIIASSAGSTAEIFPKLEILSLEQLDSLEDIYHPKHPKNWCSKLRELKLLKLMKLKSHVLCINHACNLAVVEIRDCASLQHIFSPLATTEINMSDEICDFPCLKKLELQRLSSLEGLLPGDEPIKKLFHDKMKLPALQELYLSSLDNIEKLWELSPTDLYSNLEYIRLEKMPGLTYVWNDDLRTESRSFGCLKKLEIIDCDKMVEVIETGGANNVNNVINFLWMQTLKLEKLSSLQCFYKGSYTIEFRFLKELFLSSLPEMLTFLGPQNPDASSSTLTTDVGTNQMLFINKIKFPSLEHLELHDMHKGIEKLVEEGHDAFPELKTLIMENLGLQCLPGSKFEKLERLEVCDCRSLEGPPWTSFPNLRSLVIRGSFPSMKTMVSSTEVVEGNGLPQLEYINIEDCERLEEIVSKESGNINLFKHGTLMFPKLKHIKVCNLRKFRNFSSGGYTATFPSLEKVEINDCPSLKTFSLGKINSSHERSYSSSSIEFPSLKELFLSSLPKMWSFPGPRIPDTSSSLENVAINQRSFIQINFPSLEHLELHNMHEDIEKLVEEGHDAFPKLKILIMEILGLKCLPVTIFEKLERLVVCDCRSLEGLQWTSFPNLRSLVIRGSLVGKVTMVSSTDIVQGKGLPKLEDIFIEDCDLEEIVSKEGDNIVDLSHGTHLFPQLKDIKLSRLEKFRNFSSGRYTAKLPALEKVDIDGCPILEKFSQGELVTPKLKFVQVDHKRSTEKDINLNSFLEDMNKEQSMDSIAGPSRSGPHVETSEELLQDSIQELSGTPEHEITECSLIEHATLWEVPVSVSVSRYEKCPAYKKIRKR